MYVEGLVWIEAQLKQLRITTLGVVQIDLDDLPVEGFVSRKVSALLIYLALTGRSHGREVLAELLWDDLPPERLASYLRTALSSLQKQLAPYLIVTRTTVGIDPQAEIWLDVHELDRSITQALDYWSSHQNLTNRIAEELAAGLQLYTGAFLEGFHLRNASGFDNWLMVEREHIYGRVVDAYFHLVAHRLEQQLFEEGIQTAQQALSISPLHEGVIRMFMRLLAGSGRRTDAISQYQAFETLLMDELGVEPEEETLALLKDLEADRIVLDVLPPSPSTRLPIPSTPFIGRTEEVNQICQLLQEAETRLVTLVGIGGIGKTRLALEVAHQIKTDYSEGAVFVSCTHIKSVEQLINDITNEADIPQHSQANGLETLIGYFHSRHILLVLDNFEHLKTEADFLSQLISQTQYLVLLVTSRERLNLQGEHLITVEALPIPESIDDLSSNAAAQLFIQSARRVNANFSVESEDEMIDLIQFCQSVGGMPLALELAGSWADMLTIKDINKELKQGLDILETQAQDIPVRQRSVLAAFDTTWERLNEQERQAFVEMTIFQNSFDREAVQAITGAPLRVLQMLVTRSLIVPRNQRFYMHPLIQQYGSKRLVHNTNVTIILYEHSRYYLHYVASLEADLKGRAQLEALTKIDTDIDNIRAAWEYAMMTRNIELLHEGLEALSIYFYISTRINNGHLWFQALMQQLEGNPTEKNEHLWMRVAPRFGLLLFGLGEDPELDESLEQALSIARRLETPLEEALCLEVLAHNTFHFKQARQTALDMQEASREIMEEVEDSFYITRANHKSGLIHALTGDFDSFVTLTERALLVARNSGNLFGMAHALNNLADAAFTTGDFDKVDAYLTESIASLNTLRHNLSIIDVVGSKAEIKLLQGELEEAEQIGHNVRILSSLVTSEHLDNIVWSIPTIIAILRGNIDDAERLVADKDDKLFIMSVAFVDFIAIAMYHSERKNVAQIRSTIEAAITYRGHPHAIGLFCLLLPLVSVLLAYEGDSVRATQCLSAAFNHPKSITGWIKQWTLLDTVRTQLEETLGQESFQSAWKSGLTLDVIPMYQELGLYQENSD